jgi:isopenicillin N synthase-like dioxygenase
MPDGKWRYVRHRDGAIVINIGDQLSFMSGGILKGTIHRGNGFSSTWIESQRRLTSLLP